MYHIFVLVFAIMPAVANNANPDEMQQTVFVNSLKGIIVFKIFIWGGISSDIQSDI